MFTNRDIEFRSIFVVNGLEHRKIKLHQNNLVLYDTKKEVILTKIPFQKILVVFIVGHATLTSPLIEKCVKNGIIITCVKPNFRTVFTYGSPAEGNFLLRQKQHLYPKEDIFFARHIVTNKVLNQRKLLMMLRMNAKKKDTIKKTMDKLVEDIIHCEENDKLLGIEGRAAKIFFEHYFEKIGWTSRSPRLKLDELNCLLDIGYTFLFNFIECFVRMFGFDLYCGIYHRMWFERKSLICDLVEPFRCIIDQTIKNGFAHKKFKKEHFEKIHAKFRLKRTQNTLYTKTFFEVLSKYKNPLFLYIRDYYRAFMKIGKNDIQFPQFDIS